VYDALFRTQSVTVPSPLYVFDTTVESGVLVADTGVTPSLQAVGHASPAQQSVDQTRTIVTHSGSSSGAVANASLPKARKEKVTETMRVLARDVVFGRSVSWGLQSWDVPPVRLSGDSWVADLRS
jgi:hypothetical protein